MLHWSVALHQGLIIVLQKKFSFIVIISLLLTLGFTAVSLISYVVANNSLQTHIRSNTLPLTSDNIYSEIQRDVLPTTIISSLMAQDTFVRKWVMDGETDPQQIVDYLKSVQERYKTATAFFISDSTHNYYHSSGVLKQIRRTDPMDSWYFRVENLKNDFEINVDIDTANPNRTNFFINHKVMGFKGEYLGAIGVGLSSESVKGLIEHYESRYGRQVYFIDPKGGVTLRGAHYQGADNIRQTEGLSSIATQILTSPGGSYTYFKNSREVFLQIRFVPELGWHLLVEQVDKPESLIKNTLWINLVLSFVTTLIVLLVAYLTIGKYQKRLETMATKDKLTGADNRHAFDSSFQQAIRSANRRKEPLSLVLVDIDHFKQVNDTYGHLAGDSVIAGIANVLRANLRNSDLICRWGGEEFLMLLPDCDKSSAALLVEKIRCRIENEDFITGDERTPVTASFGISSYQHKESQNTFFERADKALYRAKSQGRNRAEVA